MHRSPHFTQRPLNMMNPAVLLTTVLLLFSLSTNSPAQKKKSSPKQVPDVPGASSVEIYKTASDTEIQPSPSPPESAWS